MTILRMLLFAIFFSVLLGPLGGGIGFGLGALISTLGKMTCVEGACGIFVVMMGLAGALLGVVIAVGLGIWLGWRAGIPVTPARPAPVRR